MIVKKEVYDKLIGDLRTKDDRIISLELELKGAREANNTRIDPLLAEMVDALKRAEAALVYSDSFTALKVTGVALAKIRARKVRARKGSDMTKPIDHDKGPKFTQEYADALREELSWANSEIARLTDENTAQIDIVAGLYEENATQGKVMQAMAEYINILERSDCDDYFTTTDGCIDYFTSQVEK